MDSFAVKIFKNKIFNENKLLKFGFVRKGKKFVYTGDILDNQFSLTVVISGEKEMETKLVDIISGELYTLHLVETAAGSFVGHVKEAYENALMSIAQACCNDTYFAYAQANRLTDLIKSKYHDSPEFLWEKSPGFGVFRNPQSEKWYALISRVDRSKVDKKKSGEVEILNIKLDKDEIQDLLKLDGFYPAYHMNKKSWITIILDGSIPDEKIMELIEKSHGFSEGRKKTENAKSEWLVPCNPKYFDVDAAFKKSGEIIWKQSSNIKTGDIVYLYVGAPLSAVRYKCEASEVDIPYDYKDENLTINKVMKIRLLKKYDKDFLSFKILKDYGVYAIRGPRSIPEMLSDFINKKG